MEWLARLGINVEDFNRWGIHLAGLESVLGRVLLAALILAGLLWLRSSVRELESRTRRLTLLALHALALMMVALILLEPAIRLSRVTVLKERVLVLLDASASMSLPADRSGRARAEEGFEFISRHQKFFDKLERDFTVTYLGFDSAIHEREKRPTEPWPAHGEGTDLLSAAAGALSPASGVPVAGMIVISDGTDTSRLAELLRMGREKEIESLFRELSAPINTVALGRDEVIRDLAIVELVHDNYGFVHNPFEVVVRVRSQGGLAREIPVIFKQGDQLLATKTIVLPPGEEEALAVLSFTPREVGEFMFSVEIPPAPGEVTTLNNLVRFPLRVLRDKVRILYIVGNPSWDVRFLRDVLKKDPAVDLVSFYILREHWDRLYAPQEEVSLIPFPTHELFTQELDTFDLVIWQNFRGPMYMAPNYDLYMSELNRFVRERGGALLMIGGHRGFFGQGRLDPKLLDLLPVIPMDAIPNYREQEFQPVLSEAGRRHPIMEAGETGQKPEELWPRLPPISGYNRVNSAAPDALVLLTHPFERGADNQLQPLIAVREVGKGRVMAVMTDCSWQWSLPAAGEGLSTRPFQRFWENSVRWLLRDPEMKLLSLGAERGRVRPDQPLSLTLEVLDETYQPTDRAEVKLTVEEQPAGSRLELPEPERIGAGKYRITITPQAAGAYRIKARAVLAGRSLGEDHAIFEAAISSVEYIDVMPRPRLLEIMSKATAGKSVSASAGPEEFVFNRQVVEEVIGTRDFPLWDNGIMFGTAFCSMVLGWWLRRKWGLR